jgi:hypothetical protein
VRRGEELNMVVKTVVNTARRQRGVGSQHNVSKAQILQSTQHSALMQEMC